ncbi:hypothetical protein WA026_006337 [Henosepilachna vigintioctopunctata]|uniref:TGF-beta family profile domain-containing protein n=1 Tax=Henosepilachna vigintioctopunctata TaxID=420089 RepID=A0AAW1TJY1_9CUCU
MVLFFYIFLLGVIGFAKSSNNSTGSSSTITVKSYTNISSTLPGNQSSDGKTYFFKYNTNNNQFRIYNRVNSNVDVTKNASKISMKRKFIPPLDRSNMNELRKFEAFLDEEWNYSSSKKMTTTELPVQIYPFLYKQVVEKTIKKKENGESFTDITKILFNNKKNNSLLLNFNLGKMEENYNIENAELHFYWTVAEDSEFYRNSCVLRLYEVENIGNDTIIVKNPDTHKLLNVIYASKAQTGWQMFRISKKSINSWVNMTENLKLLISISKANQVNSTTVFNDTDNENKWRTFLILKIRDEGVEAGDIEFPPDTNSNSQSNINIYCNRIDYYIDFRKLHWSNFIIAPEGFMAYDCNGKCTRHNSASFSNHIRMLTTFQDIDTRFRIPCCVPIQFYSLPIMFYDKLGNIVIKVYKDMITARCGCR